MRRRLSQGGALAKERGKLKVASNVVNEKKLRLKNHVSQQRENACLELRLPA